MSTATANRRVMQGEQCEFSRCDQKIKSQISNSGRFFLKRPAKFSESLPRQPTAQTAREPP